jgi:hypothetical protein
MPDAGSYQAEVIFTPDDAGNYSPVNGWVQVNVSKASQTITWTQEFTDLNQGAEISLTAVSSSGLTVSYSSNNSLIAVIDQNIMTVVGPGNCIITASQEGNDNYLPAQEVTRNITSMMTGIELVPERDLKIYPIPAKDQVTIESPDEEIISVSIVNIGGNLIMGEYVIGSSKAEIDIQDLAPGTHLMLIRLSNSTVVRQIVKN